MFFEILCKIVFPGLRFGGHFWTLPAPFLPPAHFLWPKIRLFGCTGPAVLLSCCPAVLLSCCPAVLLCCCAAVLLSCCAAVLLCCCAAVLLCCCPAVLLSCCAAVLLCCCAAVLCVIFVGSFFFVPPQQIQTHCGEEVDDFGC